MRRLRRFKKVPHWILILHETILACFLEVQISLSYTNFFELQ